MTHARTLSQDTCVRVFISTHRTGDIMCNHDTPRTVDARCTCNTYPGQSHCPLHGDDVTHIPDGATYNVDAQRWERNDDDTQYVSHVRAFELHASDDNWMRAAMTRGD